MLTADWPLTGREDEFELLLNNVGEQRGSVVLAGSAGVGKTRLQKELIASLASQGRTVRRAVGTASAASIPFGAMLPLVTGEMPDGFSRASFTQRFLVEMTSTGSDGGIVAIDDAHLLDDLSAALVHQVAARALVPLVLTVRTGEPLPEAVGSVLKDGYAQRFELQPLSQRETEQLVRAALGGVVATRTIARLSETSGGNPLFLRELVLGALESGTLRLEDDVWTWSADAAPSALLKDLVASRLKGLRDDEMRALELLALGEPLELATFEHLASPEIVKQLERSGLIQETKGSDAVEVRLIHPIYAEVLRGEIAPRDAHAARAALIESVMAGGSTDATLRAAILHLRSEKHDRPELLRAGAQQAVLATDWVLAHELAAAAMEADPCIESAHVLTPTLHLLGRDEECVAVGLPFLEQNTGDVHGSGLAHNIGWALFIGLDRAEEAERVFDEAAAIAQESYLRDRLIAQKTHMLPSMGRTDEALALNLAALDEPGLDAVAFAYHLSSAGRILAARGRPLDALALIDQHISAAYAASHENAHPLMEVLISRGIAVTFAGGLSDAISFVIPLREYSIQTGNDPGRIAGSSMLAGLYAMAGRPASACEHATSILPLWQERGQAGNRDWVAALLAQSLALLGNVEEAAARHAYARSIQARRPIYYSSEITRSEAWIYAARGELSAAGRAATEAAEEARAGGWRSFEVFARYDAVRLGALDQVPGLIELAQTVQGEFAATTALHAEGLAGSDGAKLDEASRALERLGWILPAAEAAAQAGAAFEQSGLGASAAAAAERSRALAARCEGAMTPALATGARPDPLTRREREVATLAADGLTNKQIAERLVTSVRTVEGHLYQAYAKLGISRRDELRSALAGERE